LTAQEERPTDVTDGQSAGTPGESATGENGTQTPQQDGNSAGPIVVSSNQDPVKPSNRSLKLPQRNNDEERFTVQVGAFSHPAIAQQWALKWKARGFKVFLKPVARPRTGVIYRLYLGNFSSKRKADRLVKRLKDKDGIRAFRVALRN
jgi:cell division septation protein DedD